MYAVVELAGHQWKVEPGTRLSVNRLSTAVGKEHVSEQVLFAHDGKQPQIGKPYVAGAKVVFEVIDNIQGPKVIAYHFRRRENWRKTVGHRQQLTRLVVKSISCSGVTVGAEKAAKRATSDAKVHEAAVPAQRSARTSVIKPQVKSLAGKPVSRAKPAAKKED